MPTREVRGENQSNIRTNNLAVVLEAIRLRGQLSRTELVNLTHLAASAITNITRELAGYGLIHEYGSSQRTGSGRKQVLLGLDDKQFAVVGLEIARTHINALLISLTGRIIYRAADRFKSPISTEQMLATVETRVGELLQQAINASMQVLGIGVGVPGPVDTRRGIVTSPPNFPGWRNIPLGESLQKRFHLPVLLDDDAKAAALGESWFGNGVGCESMVYLSVEMGIGAGVILHGQLYRGMHDVAGEIGHVTVDVYGPRCECGNVGCLEAMAAIPALYRYAEDLAAEDIEPGLSTALVRSLGLAELFNNSRFPELASRLRYHTIRYLSAGVIAAINTYDPERIVVGGRVLEACPGLLEEMRSEVQSRTFAVAAGRVQITDRKLGHDATAIGGAVLMLHDVLSHPTNYFNSGATDTARHAVYR